MGKLGAALTAVGLAAAVCMLGAGCTPEPACAGAAIPSPAVYLDASPWLAAHPGDELDACYGKSCTAITATTRNSVQLAPLNEHPSSPHVLDVKTDADGGRMIANEKVALVSSD